MSTTTVRISESTRRALRDLARERGVSMAELLDEAVERLRRESVLEQANAAYAALRADPGAWADEQEERAEWEATLSDGLEER